MNLYFWIFSYFLLFNKFSVIYSFNQYNHKLSLFNNHKLSLFNNYNKFKNNLILHSDNTFSNKINNLSNLARTNNIIPTLILSFSGGWIVQPSLTKLLYSTQFLSANLISILIMTLSMIINDLFDVKLDIINNPSRPLVNGSINKFEAYILSLFLFLLIQYFSFTFLSSDLQIVINSLLFGNIIYTPVIKKITLFKNLFCAFVVSFTIFFSAIAALPNFNYNSLNYYILMTTIRYIFLGSLTLELLLDIRDIDGDKHNNILTIPVIFGKNVTLYLILSLIFANILNFLLLYNIFNNFIVVLPSLLLIPIFFDVYKIKINNFQKKFLISSVKNTTVPMGITLLFYSILSFLISINNFVF